MNTRYVIYPIVAGFALTLMILPGYLSSPQRNMNQIAQTAATTSQAAPLQTFSSYFKRVPGGFVLVVYTGKDDDYGATEFVVISKINGKVEIDLINGAGEENVARLNQEEIKSFLAEHQIDLDKFN